MDQVKKIVIANDSYRGIETALEKAAFIEHYSGAEVEVVEAIYDTLAEEPPEVLPDEDKAKLIEHLKGAERHGLLNLVEKYEDRIASLSVRVIWDKNTAEGLLEAASDADLVVKPVSEHHQIGDYIHTPLDWAVMREAKCPVLVSKERPWPKDPVVLAAVDVADEAHDPLTRDILETAGAVSRIIGAALHVITVYPTLGQSVSDYQVATDFEGLKTEMKASRQNKLTELIEDLGIDVTATHVIAGVAAITIAALADEIDANVTVLGTAARHGVKKLLFGNTSERIVARLKSDILTVR